MLLFLVAGARPNFMKIAPLVRALEARSAANLAWKIVHTGQHYDYRMSEAFFRDLAIPEPDHYLDAGSGSHAEQTARIMVAFEKVCLADRPDIVVVVGDVNSTLACSVVAKKLGIAVAHVEAGLRSFDLSMPEEINRMVTDAISDFFFVTEKSGADNLLREGKPAERIHFTGHVMIDNLHFQLTQVEKMPPEAFAVRPVKDALARYAFMTLHRPANVDDRQTLDGIVAAVDVISAELPVVFAIHPRTAKMLDAFDLEFEGQWRPADDADLSAAPVPAGARVVLLPPLGYKDALYLWKDADLVLTDSGGLQEETTALGISCFTIRENTERPITIDQGTNQLVGCRRETILAAWERFRSGARKSGRTPERWDGHAAERIVEILLASG